MKNKADKGVKLCIVSGTTYENIAGGKLHSYFTPKQLENLYLGLGRGTFDYGYAAELFAALRSYEYDLATTHLTIVGGGQLVKHFDSCDPEQVTIVDDICAAAKGDEYMAYRQMLRFTAPLNSRTFLKAIAKNSDKRPAAAFFAKAAAVIKVSILRIFRPSCRRSRRCRYSTRSSCRP